MKIRQALAGIFYMPIDSLRVFSEIKQILNFVTGLNLKTIPFEFLLSRNTNTNSGSSGTFAGFKQVCLSLSCRHGHNRLFQSVTQIPVNGFQFIFARSSAQFVKPSKDTLSFIHSSANMCDSVINTHHTDRRCNENEDEESKKQIAQPQTPQGSESEGGTFQGDREEKCLNNCTEKSPGQVMCSDHDGDWNETAMETTSMGAEEHLDHGEAKVQIISAPPSSKPAQSANISQLSKRAQKKLLRREKQKEQRKAKRAANFTSNSNPGFDRVLFSQTDYYFENGLRKVYPYPFTFSVHAKERWYGRTLQDVFEKEFRVDTPDNFRKSVAKGLMRVNGKVAALDYVIQNGDFIEHDIHRHENPVSGAPIEVLEDTGEVVVINKPPSIPCHPCGRFRFNSIVFIMGKELGYANLRNIYRLDRLTSGILIMGKTARKTKELENHILHRRVHKEYVARVVGEFPPEETTVDKPMDCLSHKLTLWRVVPKGGKPSRTTFQRLSYNGQTSVVKCIPHTGRTHQIRVHLQYLGHPIVNDPFYNSPAWGPQRGKGGHCDVSLEELCQRIMQEHNVGMWCDGENPLFEQRLAEEEQASEQPSFHDDNNGTPFEGDANDSVDPPTVNEAGEENGQSGILDEGSPPAKRLRLDSSPVLSPRDLPTDSVDSPAPVQSAATENTGAQDTVSHCPTSQISSPENLGSSTCVDLSPENPASETNADPGLVLKTDMNCSSESGEKSILEKETIEEEKGSGEEKCVKKEKNGSGATGTEGEEGPGGMERRSVERKGFDPKRWVPSHYCESCRLKYIDPKPSDLLLYLHALRYKGPGWDYSTKLPDWAADSWKEPEEYSKYLP